MCLAMGCRSREEIPQKLILSYHFQKPVLLGYVENRIMYNNMIYNIIIIMI